MLIGIDARLYGLEHAGLGRYVTKMVGEVIKQDKKNHFVLFMRPEHSQIFKGLPRVKVVTLTTPIYSLAEQLFLPFIFNREKLDLLHVPHFNAPIFYPGKFILTIHDLIKHSSTGPETTTRHPAIYTLKRLGYLLLTNIVIHRAKAIMVPTIFVKNELLKYYHLKAENIFVTYEAVDTSLQPVKLTQDEEDALLSKYHLVRPFIIYTGSVYPHKNVEILLEAVKIHNQNKESDLMLAISCARSVFYERLQKKIDDNQLGDKVRLLGFVPDEDLSRLYSIAMCLVHPSKMEGFGLTGLEAMKLGLPVISSNATCLPEIYGDAAKYFSPDNVQELVTALETIMQNPELRKELSIRGVLRAKRYSWYKLGKETREVYKLVSKQQ